MFRQLICLLSCLLLTCCQIECQDALQTEQPIEPRNQAPAEPVEPSNQGPMAPSNQAPVEPSNPAPMEPSNQAPVEQSNPAPMEQSNQAPMDPIQQVQQVQPVQDVKDEPPVQPNDIKDQLPAPANATTRDWTITLSQLDDCDLKQEKSPCDVEFTASMDQCSGKLSFNSLLVHFFPNDIFSNVMNFFIIPEKFDVTRFYVNTCKGHLEFFAVAREDIDLIPNRLRVSDATLSLKVMYRVESLYYAIIAFEMNGFVYIENRKLELLAVKSYGNEPLRITIKVGQISPKDFCKLFSVLEFTSQDLPSAVEELKSVSLSNTAIEGTYNIEGCFEFVLRGKPDTSDVFQQSEVFVVIKKPCSERVVAGLLAYFPSASFQQVLTGIISRNLQYKTPILWFGKLPIALHSSMSGIPKLKSETFNKVFRFFATRGMAINIGLTLNVEFPIQEYIKQVAPSIPDTSIPIKFLFKAQIYSKRINIIFETELGLSLDKSLLVFMSKTKAASMMATFKRIDAPVRIARMELKLSTQLLTVYINVLRSFSMVQGLVPVTGFEIKLQKSLAKGWQVVGQGSGEISNTLFETKIKHEDKGGFYKFLGKTGRISSYALIQSFTKDTGFLEIFSNFKFLKFELHNVFISSKVGASLAFRIIGTPQIFDYDITQYCEGLLYNNTRRLPGFAMGMIFKKINFDDLLVKMYGERNQRNSWLQTVDCGIMISNDNENDASQKIPFKFIELNEFTLKRGVSMMLRVYLPASCGGNGLCSLIKSSQLVKKSTGMLFKGEVTPTDLALEWRVRSFRISPYIEFTDVVMKITGGQTISVIFMGSLEIQGISLEGSIFSDVSGGVLVQMSMDNDLEEPFAVKGAAVGGLSYEGSFSSDTSITSLELTGKMYLGTVHVDRRITASANFVINIQDQTQSYFYCTIPSFDLVEFFEAYGVTFKFPLVLQKVKFTEPTIASYSNNELGITLQQQNLQIQHTFTVQAMILVLGLYGQCTIYISPPTFQIIVELPKLNFAGGFVKMHASWMRSSGKFDGPRLVAAITKDDVRVRLEGTAKILGVSQDVNMSVADAGYSFSFSGSILDTFEADVEAAATYGSPDKTFFRISACIPSAVGNVTSEMVQMLNFINETTTKILQSTKSRISQMETIFSQSRRRMAIHSRITDTYRNNMDENIRILEKLQRDSTGSCPTNCNDVCMNAPGWDAEALEFGRYSIGSPKWLRCAYKTPDMVCVVRCLGRSVIRNVKAFNKQKSLQKMVTLFQESKEKQRLSKEFLQKTIFSVGSIINKLGSVNNQLSVGIDIAKSMAGQKIADSVKLDSICMAGSVENAVKAKIGFSIKGTVAKKPVNMVVQASIDSRLWKTLAKDICNQVFTNSSSFKESLSKVKTFLQDIDRDKMALMHDLKEDIEKNDIGESKKKDTMYDSEEALFKKYAYMELPRYTLGNDGVVKFFSKLSPWKIIYKNDPLENAFLRNASRRHDDLLGDKDDSSDDDTEDAPKRSACPDIYNAVKGYQDILQAASGVAENFFEEKISFMKTKNRQLASLRDIEDQIKSDCYLENCTIGELNDALKYSEKAKTGIIDWVKEVKHQIGKHDRASLQILSENIGSIVEKEEKKDLKSHLQFLNNKLLNIYKRDGIEKSRPRKVIAMLEQIDLDLRDLLLNGRERRITEAAPLIFTMKNHLKNLGRALISDCVKKRTKLTNDDLINE